MMPSEEIKQAYKDRIDELFSRPFTHAKIQIDWTFDEVPQIRYDITEYIIPKEEPERPEWVKKMEDDTECQKV